VRRPVVLSAPGTTPAAPTLGALTTTVPFDAESKAGPHGAIGDPAAVDGLGRALAEIAVEHRSTGLPLPTVTVKGFGRIARGLGSGEATALLKGETRAAEVLAAVRAAVVARLAELVPAGDLGRYRALVDEMLNNVVVTGVAVPRTADRDDAAKVEVAFTW